MVRCRVADMSGRASGPCIVKNPVPDGLLMASSAAV